VPPHAEKRICDVEDTVAMPRRQRQKKRRGETGCLQNTTGEVVLRPAATSAEECPRFFDAAQRCRQKKRRRRARVVRAERP